MMKAEPEAARLNEHDADEWFAVARKFNPSMTRKQFDADWAEFQREKAARHTRMQKQ